MDGSETGQNNGRVMVPAIFYVNLPHFAIKDSAAKP